MTINEAQGQSINSLGVYLSQPVFSNGQCYAALSRTVLPYKTTVIIKNVKDALGTVQNINGKYTEDVIFTEVLKYISFLYFQTHKFLNFQPQNLVNLYPFS